MNPDDPNFPHEEYALLIGSAGAGTARGIHSRVAASRTSTDVALADVMLDARPSGIVLPKILRRKLRLLNRVNDVLNVKDGASEAAGNHSELVKKQTEQTVKALDEMASVPLLERVAHHDAKRLHSKSPIACIQNNYDQIVENYRDNIKEHLPKNYETPSSYRHIDRSRVFTCSELEKKLSKANAVLIDVQKQLQRGEEIYFLDTDNHGNIFKNWEAFIDAKPEHIGIQDADCVPFDEASLLASTTASAAPSRKMHSDLRWFSSSSYAIENGSIRKFDRKKKSSISPTRSAAAFPTISNSSPTPRPSPLPLPIQQQSDSGVNISTAMVASSEPQPAFKVELTSVSAPPLAVNSASESALESSLRLADTTYELSSRALPEYSTDCAPPRIKSEIPKSEEKEETDDINMIIADENNSFKDPIDIDKEREDDIQDVASRKNKEEVEAKDVQVNNENLDSSSKSFDAIAAADPIEEGTNLKEEIDVNNDERCEQKSSEDGGGKGKKRKQEDLGDNDDDEEQDIDTRSSLRLRKKTKS